MIPLECKAINKTTISTNLAARQVEGKEARSWSKLVPPPYYQHAKVFSKEEAKWLPPHYKWDYAIVLTADALKTLKCKTYPLILKERDAIDKIINEQLKKEYIQPSDSPYASQIFFVSKKDGSFCPVQDYRVLNKYTISNHYPLPNLKDLTCRLANAWLFTALDLRAGYNNIRIKEGDQWKAAFKTLATWTHPLGHWEPNVMPFGLSNTPATFQEFINEVLKDLIATGLVLVYLDDILIATPHNLTLHWKIVNQVLEKMAEYDLYLKLEKCIFKQRTITYLGLVIGEEEICMDPLKVEAVYTWPPPRNLHELCVFLGLIGWLQPFLEGFSHKSHPLNLLTKKGVEFNWTPECQIAFEALKSLATSYPTLAQPDLDKPFEVKVDASSFATGAALMQWDDWNKACPVAYRSQTLNQAKRGYNVYDKELLAVLCALQH